MGIIHILLFLFTYYYFYSGRWYKLSSFCLIFTLHVYTVPGAPPGNVTALVLSSAEIQVHWEEVPAIHDNGVITTYEVIYNSLVTVGGQISELTTNTSLLNATLTDLEEYVEYNISVRAYTSVGPGPYSDVVIERTLEDGKFGYFSIS